jgi:hypothetical protein
MNPTFYDRAMRIVLLVVVILVIRYLPKSMLLTLVRSSLPLLAIYGIYRVNQRFRRWRQRYRLTIRPNRDLVNEKVVKQ